MRVDLQVHGKVKEELSEALAENARLVEALELLISNTRLALIDDAQAEANVLYAQHVLAESPRAVAWLEAFNAMKSAVVLANKYFAALDLTSATITLSLTREFGTAAVKANSEALELVKKLRD